MRGKSLMFQGTASSVGKSTLCAAFLRILRQDGYQAAPFKAQNMALNSFVTREGLEMGRAQVVQAEAAGLAPSARMNPVLLKPLSDRRSQVIVNGKAVGILSAREYERFKPTLREMIARTYRELEAEMDAIVIEGAGSPAEINLKAGDIVNMSMARIADAPVVLVGDINPGGVFAALYGTVKLLEPWEQERIRGIVINKFRGDLEILKPGLTMIEERLGIPVLGVLPWMEIDLEDEDSETNRFSEPSGAGQIRVAVVRLPHLSNASDFHLPALAEDVSLFFSDRADAIEEADIAILPGTRSTIADLLWLRNRGIDGAIHRLAARGGMVIGICGGYQMLGKEIRDPEGAESRVPRIEGMGLLDFSVDFLPEKRTCQTAGVLCAAEGWMGNLAGLRLEGYEIHNGVNRLEPGCRPFLRLEDGEVGGIVDASGFVFGAYLHGLFDEGRFWRAAVNAVRERKGFAPAMAASQTRREARERALDRLALTARQHLDVEGLYRILRGGVVPCGRWRG